MILSCFDKTRALVRADEYAKRLVLPLGGAPEYLRGRAIIERYAPVMPTLCEYPADVVVRAPERKPVTPFFGSSDAKVYEALLLQMSIQAVMNQHRAVADRFFTGIGMNWAYYFIVDAFR